MRIPTHGRAGAFSARSQAERPRPRPDRNGQIFGRSPRFFPPEVFVRVFSWLSVRAESTRPLAGHPDGSSLPWPKCGRLSQANDLRVLLLCHRSDGQPGLRAAVAMLRDPDPFVDRTDDHSRPLQGMVMVFLPHRCVRDRVSGSGKASASSRDAAGSESSESDRRGDHSFGCSPYRLHHAREFDRKPVSGRRRPAGRFCPERQGAPRSSGREWKSSKAAKIF